MDVSFKQKKLLPTNDILLVSGGKRSPKVIRHFEILIFAAVESNTRLLAFGGKFMLKKTQSTRSSYSKSSFLIGRGTDLCSQKFLGRFENFCLGTFGNKAFTEATATTSMQLNEYKLNILMEWS